MSKARVETYGSTVDLLAVDTDGAVKKIARDVLADGIAEALSITSGTWTPTPSSVAGYSGTPTILLASYQRIGSRVHVSIRASGTTTGAGPDRSFRVDLPVSRANFAAGTDANGVGGSNVAGAAGFMQAVSGAQTLELVIRTATASAIVPFWHGWYDI